MNETRYMISDASKKLHVEAHVLRYWEDELEMEIPRTELGHRYYTKLHLLAFERIKQLKEAGYQLKAIKLILPKLAELDEEEFAFISLVADEMNRRAAEYDETEEIPETAALTEPSAPQEENPTDEQLSEAAATDADTSPVQAVVPYPLVHTCPEQNFSEFSPEESTDSAQQLPSNIIPITRTPSELTHEERMQQFQTVMTNIVSNALQLQAKQFGELLSDQVSEKLLREMDYLLRLRQEQEELRFQQLDESIRSHQRNLQEVAAGRAPGKKKKRK